MDDPGRDWLDEELDDVGDVPEPSREIGEDVTRPSLDAEVDLGPETLEVDGLETPELGGGGLAPGVPAGGSGGSSLGYVPRDVSGYVEGSGLLQVFEDAVEGSPFEVQVDRSEGLARVHRPDGTLHVGETDEGLGFQYVGVNFSDPEYPVDEKAFEGNVLDLGESELETREVDSHSTYGGRRVEAGERLYVSSDDTPFDLMVSSVGSTLLGLSFSLEDGEDVGRFAEAFAAPEYEGGFEPGYEDA